MKYFIWTIIVIVALTIVSGFFVVGLPQTERLRRFDERRVQDLQMLQSEIINYWRLKGALPVALHELRDDIRGFVPPDDPETNISYEYQMRGDLSFELCATFNLSTDSSNEVVPRPMPGYYEQQNWQHSAGRTCFSRTIDPQLYSLKSKLSPSQL